MKKALTIIVVLASVLWAQSDQVAWDVITPKSLPVNLSLQHEVDGNIHHFYLSHTQPDILRVWVMRIYLDKDGQILNSDLTDFAFGNRKNPNKAEMQYTTSEPKLRRAVFFPYKVETKEGFYEVHEKYLRASVIAADTHAASRLEAEYRGK